MDMATKQEVADLQGFFRYADRDGFLGSIATLLHRIWNAVKALFGQSDWQKAERACISVVGKTLTVLGMESEGAWGKVEPTRGFKPGGAGILINSINEANASAKKVEALVLPMLDALLRSINTEKLLRDIVSAEFAERISTVNLRIGESLERDFMELIAKRYVKEEILPSSEEMLPFLEEILPTAEFARQLFYAADDHNMESGSSNYSRSKEI